jgi:hypothetical protein
VNVAVGHTSNSAAQSVAARTVRYERNPGKKDLYIAQSLFMSGAETSYGPLAFL